MSAKPQPYKDFPVDQATRVLIPALHTAGWTLGDGKDYLFHAGGNGLEAGFYRAGDLAEWKAKNRD